MWRERKKTGGEYSRNDALGHRHVVVFSSHLTADNVMDFLLEFYAHPKLEVMVTIFKYSVFKTFLFLTLLNCVKLTEHIIIKQ